MKDKAQLIIVAGIGTNVGKTVTSAILTTLLQADYWKPIESGAEQESDTKIMQSLIEAKHCNIHTPAYSFRAPLAPHHAARLEGCMIDIANLVKPQTERPLVVEMAGGVCVPATTHKLMVDILTEWHATWVLVSQHYLGSINHTLLTVEALKARGVSLAGLIFNGNPNPDSEEAILNLSQLPLLGRIYPEPQINRDTIQRYAKSWHHQLTALQN